MGADPLKVPPSSMFVRESWLCMVPYETRLRFPVYVWKSCKQGSNDDTFDAFYKEGRAQWAFRNPGFVHELFNDDTSYAPVKHLYNYLPEVIEAYEALPEVTLENFLWTCIRMWVSRRSRRSST